MLQTHYTRDAPVIVFARLCACVVTSHASFVFTRQRSPSPHLVSLPRPFLKESRPVLSLVVPGLCQSVPVCVHLCLYHSVSTQLAGTQAHQHDNNATWIDIHRMPRVCQWAVMLCTLCYTHIEARIAESWKVVKLRALINHLRAVISNVRAFNI